MCEREGETRSVFHHRLLSYEIALWGTEQSLKSRVVIPETGPAHSRACVSAHGQFLLGEQRMLSHMPTSGWCPLRLPTCTLSQHYICHVFSQAATSNNRSLRLESDLFPELSCPHGQLHIHHEILEVSESCTRDYWVL